MDVAKHTTPAKPDAAPAAEYGGGQRNFPMLVGFALFQVWVTLCFFTPQLFPDAVGTNLVYEISLAVAVVGLALGAWRHRQLAPVLQKTASWWVLAVCAAAGTALIPFCFGSSAVNVALTLAAAFLTGIPTGLFNVAWCQAFAQRGNAIDFALSVVTSSVIVYILTNLAYTPAVSPLVMLAISIAIPPVCAVLLGAGRRLATEGVRMAVPFEAAPHRSFLVKLCVGIFVISLADEFMRHYYLEGTDLSFYSSQTNLLILVFKIVASVMTVTAIHRMRYEEFSFLYRASFMLALVAALLLPFADAAGSVGYAIANCGAFVFKLTVFLVSLEMCAQGAPPVLTFCIVRGVWSLDLLLGSLLYALNLGMPGSGIDPGILTIALVILVALAYMIVFSPDRNGSSALSLLGPTWHPETAADEAPTADISAAVPADLDATCARLASEHGLSPREADVLRLLARGRTTTRIEEELGISMNTVNTHVRHVFQKLEVHSRQELLDVVEGRASTHGE